MERTQTLTVRIQVAQQQLRTASRFEDEILELLLVIHKFNKSNNSSPFQDTTKAIEQWLHQFQDVLERNTIEAKQKYTLLRTELYAIHRRY